MKKKIKQSKSIIIILCVILVICAGFVGGILGFKYANIIKNEPKVKEESTPKVSNVEGSLENIINLKINNILTLGNDAANNEKSLNLLNNNLNEQTLLEFNDKSKLFTILNSLDKEYKIGYLSNDETTLTQVRKVLEENYHMPMEEYIEKIKVAPLSLVNDTYNNYFNKMSNSLNITDMYPNYLYDNENEVYYQINNCSVEQNRLLVYKDKMESIGNEINAYVYLGSIISYPEENKAVVYFDLIANKEQASQGAYISSLISLEEANNYKLDENNKNSFSKFKFTFQKNQASNYYLKSITKISD